jgi:hypothetical protein
MNMGGTMRRSCILLIWLAAGTMGMAQRGAPQPNRPDNPESLRHLDAAKKTAGDDPFLANPYNFFCIAGNARAQNNNAPDLEPTKLFDNVYAVGNSETAVYAVTSSEGFCFSMPDLRTRRKLSLRNCRRQASIRPV